MKNQNFEIISIAEDTGGIKAAGPWIEAYKAEYTFLVDKQHVVTRLYNMVNVPAAVWINEQGRIVRPNEVRYSNNKGISITKVDAEPWINGLRDWVKLGEKSALATSDAELRERVKPQNPDWAMASAEFGLAEFLYQTGNGEAAPALQGSATAESGKLELQATGLGVVKFQGKIRNDFHR